MEGRLIAKGCITSRLSGEPTPPYLLVILVYIKKNSSRAIIIKITHIIDRRFIPKHEANASKALSQSEPADIRKIGVAAKHKR
jgi:hypothetical protein